ncbi:MAG: FmdE family protein [Desulfobacteraceae bacterium]|nr:FmdE family protein [Desulfobacteraceae bacterium]
MSCQLSQDILDSVVRFHGHSCPGLAIGIRAAELARAELGDVPDNQMVCIAETDMCGVDAVQFLTGCTFGKGNLIHRDYGKMAFSFFDRESGRGFRCLLREEARGDLGDEMSRLHRKIADGDADDADQERCETLRREFTNHLMTAELSTLFDITPPMEAVPRPARILASLVCEACGEAVMESRTRRFAGRTLCLPCFRAVEQKV